MKNKVGAVVLVVTVFLFFIFALMLKTTWDDPPEEGQPPEEPIVQWESSQPEATPAPTFCPTRDNIMVLQTMEDLQKYVYTVDETAYVMDEDIDTPQFLSMDLSTQLEGNKPKILIFHTHSQETYVNSRPGEEDDTIVGVGKFLAQLLVDRYNIPVVHDVGQYDFVDGKIQRDGSYGKMEPAVKGILEKYPSIEITIDLHRDAVPEETRLVTEINGLPTARMMLFNGITRLNKNGKPVEMPDLVNPYLTENLALSLQMQLTANKLYPQLMRKIYIKPYRYSLHLRPRSMLVEVGAQNNTLEEAKNAMYPLAEMIVEVLGE